MMRDLFLGSLVACAIFLVGYSAGSLTREVTTEDSRKLRAEIEELRGMNQRLEWELKQATEELPEWSKYQ